MNENKGKKRKAVAVGFALVVAIAACYGLVVPESLEPLATDLFCLAIDC
jgi:hypothetical protein